MLKRKGLSIVILLILLCSTPSAVGSPAFAEETDYLISEAPGEVIVVYEKGCDAEKQGQILENLNEEYSLSEAEVIADTIAGNGSGQLLQLEDEEDVEGVVELLEEEEGVAFAQPNFRYSLLEDGVTNDTYFADQYYLAGWDDSFAGKCGANIMAAQEKVPGGSSVTIAILDTGCLVNHEDLEGNIDAELAYNAYTHESGGEAVADKAGHGTHVAGIAGAVTNNSKGIAGVAGNCAKIIPVKVFREDGGAYTSELIEAYDYLERLMDSGRVKNLHVINMSLGGYGGMDNEDVAFAQVITNLRKRDVLTVCAGGNGDEFTGKAFKDKEIFPGDYEDCLCVTSLAENGCNSTFSDYNQFKDISAPGELIVSSYIPKGGSDQYSSYASASGTSMASPVAAGIAGLLWAADDSLTPEEVVYAMESTAHSVNPAENNWSSQSGSAGAVDAGAAMDFVLSSSNPERRSIEDAKVELMGEEDRIYTGKEVRPEVKVSLDGVTLKDGDDYSVHYSQNVEAGTASIGITGKGQFKGTKAVSFTIYPKELEKSDVHLSSYLVEYTGVRNYPDITVEFGDRKLEWGRDFTVSLASGSGQDPGWNTLEIEGRGNFTGKVKKSFRILPEGSKAVYPKDAGSRFQAGGSTYEVKRVPGEDNPVNNAVVYLAGTSAAKKTTVPAWVSYGGHTYKVGGIKAGAFKGKKKLTKVTIKSAALTKASVKGSLSGSKVKYIYVKVGSKATNKKYKTTYKSYFAKANSGKKVKIK